MPHYDTIYEAIAADMSGVYGIFLMKDRVGLGTVAGIPCTKQAAREIWR